MQNFVATMILVLVILVGVYFIARNPSMRSGSSYSRSTTSAAPRSSGVNPDRVQEEVKEEIAEEVEETSISDYIKEAMAQPYTYQDVADFNALLDYDIDWEEPPAPTQSLKAAMQAAEQEVQNAVKETLHPKTLEEWRAEGEKKYAMYPRNEEVEIRLASGHGGTTPTVKGILKESTSTERIGIGIRTIAKQDLPDDEVARLFPIEHAKMVETFARKQMVLQENGTNTELAKQRRLKYPQAFKAAGYVPNIVLKGASMENPDPRFWIDPASLVNLLEQRRLQVAYEKELPKRMKRAMLSRGYVYRNDKWVPQGP